MLDLSNNYVAHMQQGHEEISNASSVSTSELK